MPAFVVLHHICHDRITTTFVEDLGPKNLISVVWSARYSHRHERNFAAINTKVLKRIQSDHVLTPGRLMSNFLVGWLIYSQ